MSETAADTQPEGAVRSADIIPFPVKVLSITVQLVPPATAPSYDAASLEPSERLKRALETLNAALAEQKRAVSDWRGTLVDLGDSVSGLGSSLQRLNDRLEDVKQQTKG